MGYDVTRDDENGELDELVSIIDRLIEQGDQRVHLQVDKLSDGVKISTSLTDDFKKGPCCQPNEQADDEDESE
ncbi:MAG: hypothetical protein IJU04_04545 [Ruminococcus sp.]|nr:hypothetical protein [Ruminococcus sp.]